MTKPRPSIELINAYVPGLSGENGKAETFKLSSNESALGAGAAVQAVMGNSLDPSHYPDSSGRKLKEAIASVHGLQPERIILSNGSDEMLGLMAQIFLQDGLEAVYSEHGFLVYPIATRAAGGIPVKVPEQDFHTDPAAILNHINEKTRIIFIANPNNPTGTYVSAHDMHEFCSNVPDHILVVLDSAYAEFVTTPDYSDGTSLVQTYKNVVMTRTFSKIHGLAGLRLGWGYASENIVAIYEKVRGPFNVNAIALAAGEAAVRDADHVAANISHNEVWKKRMSDALAQMGMKILPSQGNFILVHIENNEGRSAGECEKFLQSNHIYVRSVAAYGLPNWLRVSIGPARANQAFLDAMSAYSQQT